MAVDQQIQNARCEKCGATPEKGVVLIKAHRMYLCGECYHKKNIEWGEAYKKEMLEE